MTECVTCDLIRRRDAGSAPLWDSIIRTPGWDLVHAYGTSIEGWLVLVVRRHVVAIADMRDEEAAELGPLLQKVSAALRAVMGCPKTYVVQFAEHRQHPHVHFHVIPRAEDLPEDRRGPHIFESLGVPEEVAVPEARRNEIALAIREQLAVR